MNKFENSEKEDVWWFSAFTETGAYTLAATMQNKYKCKILTKPKRNDSMWEFSFTNPFKKRKDHA